MALEALAEAADLLPVLQELRQADPLHQTMPIHLWQIAHVIDAVCQALAQLHLCEDVFAIDRPLVPSHARHKAVRL